MRPAFIPTRSPRYKARQGYVDTLREITLTRDDIGQRTYIPTAEAYQIPDMSWELEGDRHTISTLGTLTIRFLRTAEIVKFLTGLIDPKKLRIDVSCYHIFYENDKHWLWGGVLNELPGGESVYPVDKLELKFVAAPAKWPDADNVKDPATGTWYKNKHLTDTVLPALLAEGLKTISGRMDIEAPRVLGAAPFFSSIDRPKKHLADPSRTYDDTCRVAGMCWDSHRNRLLVGVHDAVGSATMPWLMAYDPDTRKWTKICQFRYAGIWSFLKPPTEWEVAYLEYDATADNLYYVCRTNHPDLIDNRAHYHCRGVVAAGAIPYSVDLLDGGLFTLHDRGWTSRSEAVFYDNRKDNGLPPSTAGVDYYGDMETHQIGAGTPRHEVKECSVFRPSPRFDHQVITGSTIPYGINYTRIYINVDPSKNPRVGQWCEIHEVNSDFHQWVGRVTGIKLGAAGFFEITFEYPSQYHYILATQIWWVLLYDDSTMPGDNIFIAEPQEISCRFLFPLGAGSKDSQPMTVERRRWVTGFGNFYWPEIIAEIDEDRKFIIDEVGYVAFTSVRDLGITEQSTTPPAFVKYRAGEVAPFELTFKGYNPAYALKHGLYVASLLQNGDSRQPGKCRLYHNGVPVKTNEGDNVVETYGSIYLWDDNGTVYAAWNETGQDSKGIYYARCAYGKWNGTIINVSWRDRIGETWRATPENYITAYAHHKGRSYFGRKYRERIWVDTGLQIIHAVPPQIDIAPRFYDGGYVCIGVVEGDKTDVIQEGTLIRFRGGIKEYRAVGVTAATRTIINMLTAQNYHGEITFFALLSLDPFPPRPYAYAQACMDEVLNPPGGNFILVNCGRDERAEVAVI